MEFSPQELEFRRTVIGASETGGLIGVSPRPNKIQLFDWLVNGVRYGESNVWTDAGTYMEPWVAKKFIETYSSPDRPVILKDPREIWADTYGILRHPQYPWIGATLDRFIADTYEPVELKFINNPATVKEYGDEGSQTIPPGYHVQMVQQLAVMRANCEAWGVRPPEIAYHFAYLAGTPKAFVIEWEQEPKTLETVKDVWENELIHHLIAFREDHWLPGLAGVKGAEPPVDSSEAYSNYLLRKRASEDVTATVRTENSEHLQELYLKAVAAGKLEKLSKSAKKFYMNGLIASIGQDKGIKFPNLGSAQILGGKPKSETDWKAVATALYMCTTPENFNQLVERHTRTFEQATYGRTFPLKSLQIEEEGYTAVFGFLMNPGTAIPSTEESEDE